MTDTILVVEDDPRLGTVLLRFLEREGYTPTLVATGELALEHVQHGHPDLILLDLKLAGEMDGDEVCRRLKEDERTALIPVTVLTASHEAEARKRAIEAGADSYLTKPFEYGTLRARLRSQMRIKRLTDQLESTESVIFAMARWVEIKDPYTEGHLRRIAGYSERTAIALGLSAAQVRTIRYAGILHDIGKIGVREAILRKPGPLDPEEEAELRRHAEHGAEIVAPLRFAAEVSPIILAHHEHWDGKGYPFGIRGEEIPIGARIISVVDAWDAMTTDRPYRRSLGRAEATRRLKAGAGSQWDPAVVDCFLELVASGELDGAELPETGPPPSAEALFGERGERAA
jgi:putative two-component system response regulator